MRCRASGTRSEHRFYGSNEMAPRSHFAEESASLGSFESEAKRPVPVERHAPPDVGQQAAPRPRRRVAQLVGGLSAVAVVAVGLVVWSSWNSSAATPAAPKDGS